MKQIIHNSIMTPDGTILVSRSVHDYVQHTDANGKTYMTDGGNSYIHRSAHGDETPLDLYEGDPHDEIREVFTWGTYGKMGDQPLKFKALKDLSDAHIEAILETQSHIPQYMRNLFIEEQVYRINNKEARVEDDTEVTPNSL